MSSPTSRTVKALEEAGWVVGIVERRISRKVTKDLFGIGDILAMMDSHLLMVQATNQGNHGNHRKKVLASPNLAKWCANRGRTFEIWSWDPKKDKPRIERLDSAAR